MNREEAYKDFVGKCPDELIPPDWAFNAGWDAHAKSTAWYVIHRSDGTSIDHNGKVTRLPEAIWDAWPVKKARGAAIPAIAKAIKKRGAEQLLADVKEYAKAVATWTPEQRGPNDCFVPMCATWMNQERYMDDRATWRSRANAPAQSQFSRSH